MAVKDKQQVSFRISSDVYEKFKVIADQNSRPIANQIEYLIKECVKDYERENGNVVIQNQNNNNGNGQIYVTNLDKSK